MAIKKVVLNDDISQSNASVPEYLLDNGDGTYTRQESLATLLAGEDELNNVLAAGLGPIVAAQYSFLPKWIYQSVTGTIKATPGVLRAVQATNANAAARYLVLYNAASASGAPLLSIPLAASTGLVTLDAGFFGEHGLYFSTAICYGFSTAANTYTAGTAADHTLLAVYA